MRGPLDGLRPPSSNFLHSMTQKIRPQRERLDRALVSRGLAASREDAARLILAGLVRVDGIVIDKAAKPTLPDALVEVTGSGSPYVGRGEKSWPAR